MARTPAERSGHREDQSPSPEDRATGWPVVITLTSAASRYAGKHSIAGTLAALRLDSDCAVGDLVSLEDTGTRHDFAIVRRRWIASGAGATLELTLDHPARSF
jgi:hypothetical protein